MREYITLKLQDLMAAPITGKWLLQTSHHKHILLFVLCGYCTPLLSQNLVINPSFEEYDTCKSINWNGIDDCTHWEEFNGNAGGTPDHFHKCNGTVPNNSRGVQEDLYLDSGYAYIGTYVGGSPNLREYFYAQLDISLKPGRSYCVTYYISLAEISQYATDGAQVHFSSTPLSHSSNENIPVTPHVWSDSIVSDTANWIRIHKKFTASTVLWYITIGNFDDDTNTPTQLVNSAGSFDGSAYYFDNISVVEIRPIEMLDSSIYACSDSVMIGDKTEDFAEYKWSPTSGLSDSTSYRVMAFPDSTTTYTLTKITPCDTQTAEVTVIPDTVTQLRPVEMIITSGHVCDDSLLIGDVVDQQYADYSWSPTQGLSSDTSHQVMAFPDQTTTYTLTKTTNCDTNSAQVTIEVDDANCQFEYFDIYPNPSKGVLTFNYSLGMEDENILLLFNSIGQKVKEYQLPGGKDNTEQVTVPYLSMGVYIYRLEVNGEVRVTGKLIVSD